MGGRLAPAVTPHLGVSWQTDSGWILTAQDMLRILPGPDVEALGVYNHLAVGAGYGWEKGNFTVGVAFPAYLMPACRGKLCARVAGVGLGGYGQGAFFFAGPLGVSLSVNVDWLEGKSLSLRGGPAAMAVAGPVVRW